MRIPVLLLTLLLSGCATTSGQKVAPAADAATNALYAEIERASARLDQAVAHYGAGETQAAQGELAAARTEWLALGDRCIASPGREGRPGTAAHDALREPPARFPAVTPEDAEPVNGESATQGEGDSPVVRAMPQAARTVAMLKGRDLAKVIQLNEPLKAALEEWLTWMRPQL